MSPFNREHGSTVAPRRAATRALLAALWLAACSSGPGAGTTNEGGAAPPAPAPAAVSPPASAQGAGPAPDTARPNADRWPARAVLNDNALAVSTYAPGDPSACGLPAVERGDGRATVVVFHGCEPTSGPALDAVPARRVSVPAGTEPMEAAVRAQLAGASEEEKGRGFVSNFGPGTAQTPFTLRQIDGGLVVLDLHPSVRSQPMTFVSNAEARQLVAVLGQFQGVQRVAILIGGQPLCKALGQC